MFTHHEQFYPHFTQQTETMQGAFVVEKHMALSFPLEAMENYSQI
jgi:hypothetical protein